MPSTKTVVSTPNGSKYLQQLCKHFAHKVTVEYDPHTARVDFPFGDCRMWADHQTLRIECDSATDEALQRARFVLDDHLTRFAWREKPQILWTSGDEEIHAAG